MKKKVFVITAGAVVFVLVAGTALLALYIRHIEYSLTFQPQKYPVGNWSTEVLGVTLEDCYFETEDGVRLHGWFAPSPGADTTLLFCHGNGANVANRRVFVGLLTLLKMNVFVFDYRGYGRSEGKPSEEGLYRDAAAAYDYLVSREEVSEDKVIVLGRSLGGVVAIDLVLKRKCAGLIVESSMTSAKEATQWIGPRVVPWIPRWLPTHLLLKHKLNSIEKIPRVDLPLLFTHGTADELVPIELGRRLFDAAPEPKWFYPIEGAHHNDTFVVGGSAYFLRIKQFVDNVTTTGPDATAAPS